MDKNVLLGFSGGMDSTMAVRLLQDDDYNVTALTIDTIGDDAMLAKAEAKAQSMGIRWFKYDAREMFNREVVEYFCAEYSAGRTPAPCTRCNTLIKWKILREVADNLGIYHIATGHYFNVEASNGHLYVAKGIDPAKDQSYYLWGLDQETLRRAVTPMGQRIKQDVKQHFADKSESMGICFLGGKHYTDFLSQRGIGMTKGDVINSQGEVCGHHNGIVRYTSGQRRGEGIPEGLRVLTIDAGTNSVVVGTNDMLYKHKLYINNCNIVDERELLTSEDITVKIRGIGRNPEHPVCVERDGNGYMVSLNDPAWAPAIGQPLVFYRKNMVIGGGIVVGFE